MSSEITAHLFLGPLLFVVALFFKVQPPKKINAFVGYRTHRSMRSGEAWEEANRYSASLLVRASLLVIIVQALSIGLVRDTAISFTISMVALFAAPVFVIFATERHLKRNFDKDGKRIA